MIGVATAKRCLWWGRNRLRGLWGESTLIVPVPQASEIIAACGAGPGSPSDTGVQPHITVLYPFVPPRRIDDGVLTKLAETFDGRPSFAFSLGALGHFPGVTWLRPSPAAAFTELTNAVVLAFPDHPPYRGAHGAVMHHLTLSMIDDLPEEVLGRVMPMLPVVGTVDELVLLCRQSGRPWRVRARFALATTR